MVIPHSYRVAGTDLQAYPVPCTEYSNTDNQQNTYEVLRTSYRYSRDNLRLPRVSNIYMQSTPYEVLHTYACSYMSSLAKEVMDMPGYNTITYHTYLGTIGMFVGSMEAIGGVSWLYIYNNMEYGVVLRNTPY